MAIYSCTGLYRALHSYTGLYTAIQSYTQINGYTHLYRAKIVFHLN